MLVGRCTMFYELVMNYSLVIKKKDLHHFVNITENIEAV